MTGIDIIKIGGMEIHYCLTASDTQSKLTMFKCVIGAEAKIPVAHYHENFDETVYCLNGAVTYTVDGKTIELQPGDSLFIPRGAVHAFVEKPVKLTTLFQCKLTTSSGAN